MTDPHEDQNPAASEEDPILPTEADQPPPDDVKPANVDDQGRAHFAVLYPDGEERCGGCNNPWPCDDAVHLLVLPTDALE